MAASRATIGRSSSATAASTAAISSASGGSGMNSLAPARMASAALARIGVDAAGHDRHADALGLVGGDQAGDVELVVDHQQVGALAGAQRVGGRLDGLDVG